jgi:hypothetical protein
MPPKLGQFKRPTAAAAAPPGKGRAPVKRKSRYAGITADVPRDPMPEVGEYILKVVECTEGVNPGTGTESFKATFEVVDGTNEAHAAGDQVVAVFLLTGKGGPSGLPRVKSLVMAAAGYESEDEFNAFDPDGEFIDACTGAVNAYSEAGLGIAGRYVFAEVKRGKDVVRDGVPTGDYYREFSWGVVADDSQEIPRPGLQ